MQLLTAPRSHRSDAVTENFFFSSQHRILPLRRNLPVWLVTQHDAGTVLAAAASRYYTRAAPDLLRIRAEPAGIPTGDVAYCSCSFGFTFDCFLSVDDAVNVRLIAGR